MTSTETIHETIARMRRRVSEIDCLIESIERYRNARHEVMEKDSPLRRPACRKTMRSET